MKGKLMQVVKFYGTSHHIDLWALTSPKNDGVKIQAFVKATQFYNYDIILDWVNPREIGLEFLFQHF